MDFILESLRENTFGNPCKEDSDCSPPYMLCGSDETCVHKDVFPLYGQEFGGMIVLSLMLALANAGGIGGGEMIVPVCKIFFRFSEHAGVAIA